jgi:transcriptional regulator GlxA family with amidase domain
MEILEIKKWIEANLKRIHTVDDVANALNVSNETLRKDFRRVQGESPWQFIRVRKVKKMKHLLVHTHWKCVSIALEVGMREESAASIFREITGQTMDEFRRLYGNNKAKARAAGGVEGQNETYQNSQPKWSTVLVNQNG